MCFAEALRQRFGPKVVGKQSAKELAASLRSLSKDDLVKLMVDRSLKEQEEKEEKEEKESTVSWTHLSHAPSTILYFDDAASVPSTYF
jgi:hypothetical protein